MKQICDLIKLFYPELCTYIVHLRPARHANKREIFNLKLAEYRNEYLSYKTNIRSQIEMTYFEVAYVVSSY